ncbi:hydrophobic toxin [Bacillus glycinifermentans]|uniref:Holin-like toxin n=1 Tax=Bacillus glycinifermentans TaxID=1664069 RepID=A0A0J6HUF8_9BACI|nr:putative holin-like toxin [Bacillus glycinifermentans]ATH91988.1 hydrophobic toxin [Bacillus glycinifermentans]KMM62612.1 hydrophobic toxin [Bacillus glycinifermentans]KRT92950.1 hydrophobic toxin [Bacillus glycinifermentans]MEC0486577.1 putative holin-like toxin [Bacillus glycinifermentans]MEC0494862.1 putative holin-like toxin [Bacillus glycinifermentans]
MTTFETISLMIAFGMLIAVLSKKKNRPPLSLQT